METDDHDNGGGGASGAASSASRNGKGRRLKLKSSTSFNTSSLLRAASAAGEPSLNGRDKATTTTATEEESHQPQDRRQERILGRKMNLLGISVAVALVFFLNDRELVLTSQPVKFVPSTSGDDYNTDNDAVAVDVEDDGDGDGDGDVAVDVDGDGDGDGDETSVAFWETPSCHSVVMMDEKSDRNVLWRISRVVVRQWWQEQLDEKRRRDQLEQNQVAVQRPKIRKPTLLTNPDNPRPRLKQAWKKRRREQKRQEAMSSQRQRKRQRRLSNNDNSGEEKPPMETQHKKELAVSESLWRSMLEACHGPVPKSVQPPQLTAMQFLREVITCASKDPAGGHFCKWQWVQYLQNDMGLNPSVAQDQWSVQSVQEAFITAAKCALHMEYPLFPSPSSSQRPSASSLNKRTRPTKAVLVTVVAGNVHLKDACKLLRSALRRGWHVIVGRAAKYAGHVQKYQLTRQVMDLVLPEAADETVVVFVDGTDNLVLRNPDYVMDRYQTQPYDFLWSSNILCYPVGFWPHNVGEQELVCDNLFPRPADGAAVPFADKPHSINSGGWLATVSSAHRVLEELLRQVQKGDTDPRLDVCYNAGTDQLLANVQYLQHPRSIGVDAHSEFFRTNLEWIPYEWILLDFDRVCFMSGQDTCPAFFHFSGHYLEKHLNWTQKFLYWSRLEHLCEKGTLTVVDLDSSKIYTKVEESRHSMNHCTKSLGEEYCWPCGSAVPWDDQCDNVKE